MNHGRPDTRLGPQRRLQAKCGSDEQDLRTRNALSLIKGLLVTIDAMGRQKSTAKQIVAKTGDYLLGTSNNPSFSVNPTAQ
ncbi:hypothetical protein ACUH78_13300 [Thauera sp. ZXT1-4]|uniref:hypothetical protein n=1 Tax=Thauera sp. ZXT1-4 TaxID=3460294 RepID=UPI0040409E49